MSYILPSLSYNYDALEPYFDEKTMKIHHTKHHQTYVDNTNDILKDFPEFSKLEIEDLIQNLNKIPLVKRTFLRNNAGGHANHSMFWKGLKIGTELQGQLKSAIERDFVSVENFKQVFEKTALTHFGSGWAWLILTSNDKLVVISTSNQDNPLMGNLVSNIFGYPILGLDLWEHAYYLKYENRRQEYIQAFWSVINWDEAAKRFAKKTF
ncbi:Superoxide dismutase, Mn [Candidatus Arsenophonus lipoptenae]|uniref:Superoxide dismutase n=1 Tax=Candidatus Arsenophonus lipoptenae TaxID=634113 RepID=A0A109QB72_9GAMM|nr:Fe-Mn family superoxide dismutase [Candidatus Arsenophonus lipoptenae]AMA64961.1 Superoxide dismutase, Mn [Candidatus Arsenophonus lipoptenae]